MKYTTILSVALFLIKISLSDGNPPKNGLDRKKYAGTVNSNEIERSLIKKEPPRKINVGTVDSNEVIEQSAPKKEPVQKKYIGTLESDEEVEQSSPKKPATKKYVGTVDSNEEVEQHTRRKNLSDLKNEVPSITKTAALGKSRVNKFQKAELETKKLATTFDGTPMGAILENLTSILRNSSPKLILKLLPYFLSTVKDNASHQKDVAATPRSRADIMLPSCKINDANINTCLEAYLQKVVKYSRQGNPKYSIPSFDPYFLPRIVIPANVNNGVRVELTDARMLGFSESEIVQVISNPVKGMFDIYYITPKTTIQGQYSAIGRYLNGQINSEDKFEVSFFKLYHGLKVKGELRNHLNGNKYLVVESVNVRLKPMKMEFRFDNLFKYDKKLSNIINKSMNDDWRSIFFELQPQIEAEMSKYLFKVISNFFNAVPYNEIFPDI